MGFRSRFIITTICLGLFVAILAAGGASAGLNAVASVTETSDSDSSAKKKLTATCPDSADFASGGGAKVGPSKVTKVALTISEPTGTDQAAGPTGWKAKAVEVVDQSKDWALRVTVVCIGG